MKIRTWIKPTCCWSKGVLFVLDKYNLNYEVFDILSDPDRYAEMTSLTGQSLAPCVEVNGVMLSDIGGEEVEEYLISNSLIDPKEANTQEAIPKKCDHD